MFRVRLREANLTIELSVWRRVSQVTSQGSILRQFDDFRFFDLTFYCVGSMTSPDAVILRTCESTACF